MTKQVPVPDHGDRMSRSVYEGLAGTGARPPQTMDEVRAAEEQMERSVSRLPGRLQGVPEPVERTGRERDATPAIEPPAREQDRGREPGD